MFLWSLDGHIWPPCLECVTNRVQWELCLGLKHKKWSEPGFCWRELFEIVQWRRHVQQLLVERQRKVQIHHSGVIDGQTADDPDQMKPVLLHKTLGMQTHLHNTEAPRLVFSWTNVRKTKHLETSSYFTSSDLKCFSFSIFLSEHLITCQNWFKFKSVSWRVHLSYCLSFMVINFFW